MPKCFSISVSGKVQGVFYRASAKEQADRLKIKGFVRNEPDGRVYLEAEGDEAELIKLIAWCKQGSPNSRIEHLEWHERPLQNFGDFTIQK
ncbi:MAG: acylphosphatase [Bacteroidetes bacterium]|nr:acylphosphatase [Bacteroidota bacterium]